MDTGLFVLRIALATVMTFHGTEKLFGWWGGEGLDGAAAFFARQGFRPPLLMASVAGLTETGAGLLVGFGAATPLAAAALIGTLANVVAVHIRNGFSRQRNGIEYEFTLLAATLTIALTGPGQASLDEAFGWTGINTGWKLAAVALGVLSGLGVVATRRRPGQPTPPSSEHATAMSDTGTVSR